MILTFLLLLVTPSCSDDELIEPINEEVVLEYSKKVILVEEGTYYIRNVNSGLYLDIADDSKITGKNVETNTLNREVNQQWIAVSTEDNNFYLKNKNSGHLLSVRDSNKKNGANVIQLDSKFSSNQQWILQNRGEDEYSIINSNSKKSLDVSRDNPVDGSNVKQWTYWGGANQKWQFIPISVHTQYNSRIKAKSTSYQDVKEAVFVANSGDTVQLPVGVSDWGMETLNVPGGITLMGSGKTQTIIKRTKSTKNFLLNFDGSNGMPSKLLNMGFKGSYNNDKIYSSGVGFTKDCVDFEVSGCRFSGFANAALTVGHSKIQRGVIYKNEFIDNYYSSIRNLGYGVAVYGNGTWSALELGTQNAVFIEDNLFLGNRHHVASNNGSHYVFRYNEVIHTDPVKNYSMTDVHGKSATPTGSRSYEIYNNTYKAEVSGALARTAVGIRGGDGVIFNNSCTNKIYRTVELWSEGYACGVYPGVNQIRSLYIWNNESHDELGITKNGVANQCDRSIKENRDYFLKERPGYTPYRYPHPLRSR